MLISCAVTVPALWFSHRQKFGLNYFFQYQYKIYYKISDQVNTAQKFLLTVLGDIEMFSSDTLTEVLSPILDIVHYKFTNDYKLTNPEVPEYLGALRLFTLKPFLASVSIATLCLFEPCHETMWFPNRFGTNGSVQAPKIDKSFKFWV